jgi:hypothetical protein
MWETMTIMIVVLTAYLVLGMLFLHSAGDPGGVVPRLLQWTFWPVTVPLGRRGTGRHAATPAAMPVPAAFAPPATAPPTGPSPAPAVAPTPESAPPSEAASEQPTAVPVTVEDQDDLPVEDPPDPGTRDAWENFVRRLSS